MLFHCPYCKMPKPPPEENEGKTLHMDDCPLHDSQTCLVCLNHPKGDRT